MKKNYLTIFLCAAICFCCAANAPAQTPVRAAASAARKAKAARPKLPPVPNPAPVPAVSPQVPPAPEVVNSYTSNFLTKYRRELVALQKIVFNQTTRQAVERLSDWGARRPAVVPRPKPRKDHAFTTADLTPFKVPLSQFDTPAPAIPFQRQRGFIYRGMGLSADGTAIRNILQNGLRVQDVGPNANTLRFALAGARARGALSQLSKPITNLTSDPNAAVFYATRRLTENHVGVVAVVKSAKEGNIIIETENIPAAKIYAVAALLYINGERVWCKIEPDGTNFRVTPYEPWLGGPVQ